MITLATLPQATEQQVFDQVVNHLLAQGVKSIDAEINMCQYRLGSLSCAAGCLIADDEYNPDFEGNNWDDLLSRGCVPVSHCDLIDRLQNIHDACGVGQWPAKLQELAETWGLQYRPNTED